MGERADIFQRILTVLLSLGYLSVPHVQAASYRVEPQQIGPATDGGVVTVKFMVNSVDQSYPAFSEYRLMFAYDSIDVIMEEFTFDNLPDGSCWNGYARQLTDELSGCRKAVVNVRAVQAPGEDNSPILMPENWPLFTVRFRAVGTFASGDGPGSPLEFFWVDCLDNSFVTNNGDTVLIAEEVFDSNGSAISGTTGPLPSDSGPPDSCLTVLTADWPEARAEIRFIGTTILPDGNPTDVEDDESIQDRVNGMELLVSPNPIQDNSSFMLSTAVRGHLSIQVFDILGRKRGEFSSTAGAGTYQISLSSVVDVTHLPSGVYFCRMTLGNESICKRMIRIR
ncbi:MAG TPA: T9SS type A sorting domain-containing protein [candidate division Zixibacteria bacterium]|nr:T9SS type A sorting domain-containing protein [candidate division Zixibacteria bacterium]